MPLYEWHCARCGLTFERLAGIDERQSRRRCPACGASAARAISSFAIAAGEVSGQREIEALTRPLAPPVPPAARFCWMNDQAAERFAAYRMGRGAEYDDRQARARELREQRGLSERKPASGGRKRAPVRKPGR
jgi:putative FmdB family regulatory protein